jgi:thiamine pyrophosphate-dependent acetolactate synthase large subunit-like protein
MIINIRGTSGTGKSTIVRAIMAHYDTRMKVRVEGRKQPLGYICHKHNHPSLAVVGHYETACGGCDTISPLDRIYELVEQSAQRNYDVLYEGLLISAEVNRAVDLASRHDLVVMHLDVPLDVCVDSINQRRWAKNPDKPPVNPRNTEQKHKGTKRAVERLAEAGVECHSGGRDVILELIERKLGL